MGSRLCVLVVSILLYGCGPLEEVEERKQYWVGETGAFFQQSRTLDQVHPWLRERNVFYTFEDSDITDGAWTVDLEKIYTDSFRCEWVDIHLQITVSESKEVQNHKLEESGACLW